MLLEWQAIKGGTRLPDGWGRLRVALGFFIIILSVCGAGTMAFLFFSLAYFTWKKERKMATVILFLLGGLCAVFAVFMAAMLWDGIRFLF